MWLIFQSDATLLGVEFRDLMPRKICQFITREFVAVSGAFSAFLFLVRSYDNDIVHDSVKNTKTRIWVSQYYLYF